MKVLFEGKVPNDQSYPNDNDDAFYSATANGKAAVSDGASESFDSKTWAHLLAERFVNDSRPIGSWLDDAVSAYQESFVVAQLSWSKQAAFERGSFATLLGIKEDVANGTVDVLCVGDTLAVLLDGDDYVDSFPFTKEENFGQRRKLLSTNRDDNSFVSLNDFVEKHCRTWPIKDRTAPFVLCMTDGLGKWALRGKQDGRPVWNRLAAIKEVTDLEKLVIEERRTRMMCTDDTTLVRLSFATDDRNGLPNP